MSSINEYRRVEKGVESRLLAFGVHRGDGILVGCSGGPDSTALLALLASLRSWDLRLVACYVDHGLRDRKEIESEISFVGELGRRFEVPVAIATAAPGEVSRMAREGHGGVEEAARRLRYAHFKQIVQERRLDWVAVGHTLDDQAETLLMRILQGAGIAGLRGIAPSRSRIIRPLLGFTREQLLDILRARGLGYRIDSSNREERYLRNRLRSELLPAALALFPSYRQALASFAGAMRSADELVEARARRITWTPRGAELWVSATILAKSPPEVKLRSVLRELNRIGIGGRIPAGFFRPVLRLRVPDHGWDRRKQPLVSGRGISVERRGEWVVLRRGAVVLPSKKSYLIEVYGDISVRIDGRLTITVTTKGSNELSPDAIGVERESTVGPVIVRSRRIGDRIALAGGTVSLKELFVDWRISPRVRELVPVIEDRQGIIAVLGKGLGRENRVASRFARERSRMYSTTVLSFEVSTSGVDLE